VVLPLLEQLSSETAERVVVAGTRRRYPARTFLFHEGDEPNGAFIVEEGLIRIDRTLSSGRNVLLTLATAGDLLGELSVVDGSPRSATASTVTDSRLLVIPMRAFADILASDPDLSARMLGLVIARLRALTDQLVEAAAHGAASRVAARIVDLMRIAGADPTFPTELRLPITQEELAQWAGLSREGAVKGLAELRTAGIIETGRKRMTILDPDRLRSFASRPDA
jgi:CRP/FNR family cyclic AMP-dependent transcriptional regulator